MQRFDIAYNIEIFDRQFNLIDHYTLGGVSYKYDYLNTTENRIIVAFNAAVEIGQYIHLDNGIRDYFGVISGVFSGEVAAGFMEVRYRPFISIFDAQILFDTDLQPGSGSGSTVTLEQMIADTITAYWISNADASQNIPGLSVRTISSTPSWGFHLTSDIKGLHKTIINFQTAIIQKALTKYQVGLYAIPDYVAKTITIEIGVKALATYVIEADLPSVIVKNIVLNENSNDINKLVIYDNTDLTTNIIYYKHPDRSYDTTDADRITPVIYSLIGVSPTEEDPFLKLAQQNADKTFDQESYNNLIELTVTNEDELVMASNLTIGQVVSVVSDGVIYPSLFTGVEIGSRTKLIFGTVRIELTKILKGARNG